MGATVFEIAVGGRLDAPLVKGVGTKRLGKGRVKGVVNIYGKILVFDFFKHYLFSKLSKAALSNKFTVAPESISILTGQSLTFNSNLSF